MNCIITILLIGALLMSGLLLALKRGIYIVADVPNVQAGTYVDIHFTVVGAKYGETWTLLRPLPPGLDWTTDFLFIGSGDHVARGVPTTPGDYTFAVNVVDGQGNSATREFTMKITAADALKVTDGESTTPSDLGGIAIMGETTNIQLAAFGGVPPYSATFQSGDLVAGLSFSPVTWGITGTPTATGSAQENWLVEDSSVPAQSIVMHLNVTAQEFEITTDELNLPQGTRGAYFQYDFGVNPNATEATWSQPAGTLPTGLNLQNTSEHTAQVVGYPEVTTTQSSVTIQADSAGGASDTYVMNIVIDAATITVEVNLPDGQVGVPYFGTLEPIGGFGGYTAVMDAIGADHFPDGLTFRIAQQESSHIQSWEIVGTPSNTPANLLNGGVNEFDVIFTDAFGNSHTEHCSITIAPTDLVYVDTDIPNVIRIGELYHGEFSIAGGIKPYGAFTVVAGTMPPGLTVRADDPFNGIFYFGHVPTTVGDYTFTLRAQDGQSVPDTVDHEFFIRVKQ